MTPAKKPERGRGPSGGAKRKRSRAEQGGKRAGAAGRSKPSASRRGEQKTRPTDADVEAFLESIEDEEMRHDARRLVRLMRGVTRRPPVMWGPSIVGFGRYRYRYASGREGEWMLTGFAPRRREFSLYLMCGLDGNPDLLKRLGKHRRGKGCLYVRRLADVDLRVLRELVRRSVAQTREKWG